MSSTRKELIVAMERAGLTDPDGDIAAQFQQQPVLYIPSVVAIEQIEETFQISYKVPKRVWKKTPYPHLDLDALCASGWTVKEQTQGLIPDLLRLAESDRNAVVEFASRWGPLWACSRHPSCLVTDINPRFPPLKVHCRWEATEDPKCFLYRAKQIRAAFNLAVAIDDPSRPPTAEDFTVLLSEVAPKMPYEWFLQSPEYWPPWLVLAINFFIGIPSGQQVWLEWEEGFRFQIGGGLGFLRSAWLQVAQLLAQTNAICYCDSCGKTYSPRRKPRKGEKHYCMLCGKSAAKRDYARRRRSLKEPGG